MQVCTLLQTDNHASTPALSFYRPDALPAAQPTVITNSNNCYVITVITYLVYNVCTVKRVWVFISLVTSSNLTTQLTTVTAMLQGVAGFQKFWYQNSL